MKVKNGVLEWRSNGWKRNGVKEYWSDGLANRLCGAGPEAGVPWRAREAGTSGKRWVEMRANPGLSGRMAGKWTGFSHLFPDDSTQVVDFPRMCNVRVFLRDKKTPESWQGNDRQRNSQAGLGTNMGSDVRRGKVWDGVESVPTARRPRSSCLAAGPFT